jgi:hypothetical protein
VQTRIENERYLRSHPELQAMLKLFSECVFALLLKGAPPVAKDSNPSRARLQEGL